MLTLDTFSPFGNLLVFFLFTLCRLQGKTNYYFFSRNCKRIFQSCQKCTSFYATAPQNNSDNMAFSYIDPPLSTIPDPTYFNLTFSGPWHQTTNGRSTISCQNSTNLHWKYFFCLSPQVPSMMLASCRACRRRHRRGRASTSTSFRSSTVSARGPPVLVLSGPPLQANQCPYFILK